MTPERWQQIDQLFHAALAHEPDERSDFIAAQCEGDESLRIEVESLISFHQQDESFFGKPASDIAAEMLGVHRPTFRAGDEIDTYRIVRELGAGGMGEVYLADDTKLNRQIALKLLPAHLTEDRAHLHRFEREARAASALNHPNIVTVHDIGQVNGIRFIATEFVNGETLRVRLAKHELRLGLILEVATQVALALSAAHEAGIVHRDIKPENIMLRLDGFVKVLDFGLAKLTSSPSSAKRHRNSQEISVRTDPGLVMGTMQYMSPEQARGEEVDARTDIWSLGVVLYEMLAGKPPFTGDTPNHVTVAIVESDPPPLTNDVRLPEDLSRIVLKALSKEREKRYQTAAEMVRDLKTLRENLTVESRLEKLRKSGGAETKASSVKSSSMNVDRASLTSPERETATRDAPLQKRPQGFTRRLTGQSMTVAAVVLIGAAAAFYLIAFRPWRVEPASPFQKTQTARLTNTGDATLATISADGKYVAYAVREKGTQSLWLKEVAAVNSAQIVQSDQNRYIGLTFSNDGKDVYYVVKPKTETVGALYRVPAAGGQPTKLISDVDSPVSFSPDGQKLAFVRGSFKGEYALMIANVDGTGEKRLSVRQAPDLYDFGGPAWSPDGAKILCAAGNHAGGRFYENVVEVPSDGGNEREVSPHKWQEIGRINWLRDGSGFTLLGSDRDTDQMFQVWFVSYLDGMAYRVTNDYSDYRDLHMTPDANALVAVRVESNVNIWQTTLRLTSPGKDHDDAAAIAAKQLTFGVDRSDGSGGMTLLPDDRIIYRSRASGRTQIWIMNADGSQQHQLTKPDQVFDPMQISVAPDGSSILFVSTSGYANIWRMATDGSGLRQLTNGRGEYFPGMSPDGKWLVYASNASGQQTIWRIPLDTQSPPQQLTQQRANHPVISPDGKWIACNYRDEQGGAQWRIAVVPAEGGPPAKIFEIPSAASTRPIRWYPDGSAITYINMRDEDSIVWSQPLDGGPPRKLADFKTEKLHDFAWSQDGRLLAVSRGAITTDVVLIKNLR